MVLLNERQPPFEGEKVLRNAKKNTPTKRFENVIEKKGANETVARPINMYERIEKCEVNRKDWKFRRCVDCEKRTRAHGKLLCLINY